MGKEEVLIANSTRDRQTPSSLPLLLPLSSPFLYNISLSSPFSSFLSLPRHFPLLLAIPFLVGGKGEKIVLLTLCRRSYP